MTPHTTPTTDTTTTDQSAVFQVMLTQLQPVLMPLSELHPWPGNARVHNERNLAAIASSLRQFGQRLPLVVQKSSNRIIGGNGTAEAIQSNGGTHAIVVLADIDDVQASALNLELNRTPELATWDFHLLGDQVRGLETAGFDISLLSWTDYEFEPLLAADWEPPKVDDNFEIPSPEGKVKAIVLSADQRESVERAVGVLRDRVGDEHLSEGRAIEIICSEWLVPQESPLRASDAS